MPYFGAHLSIAGGLHNAISAAEALACQTVQLFTKNSNQWKGKPLTPADVATFREAAARSGLKHLTAHDSYLINLAAPADELYEKSIAAFQDEVERAESLGLDYLVMHPGAHTGSGDEAGLERVVAALDRIHAACPGFHVQVLLETTAGQGTTLGHRFEHLAYLLKHLRDPERVGVCVDTCHIFAAGYPLAEERDYNATFAEFDRLIGLERIRVFHLNDSVKGLGCRVDRHAGIGLGQIGEDAFRRLVNDRRFAELPMILETPKEDADGQPMDPINLAKLRGFLTKSRGKSRK